MIAKLHAYGLSLLSLNPAHDYLLNRKQRTKINLKYNSYADVLKSFLGSILGRLLYNIHNDLFIINDITSFVSYADDNAPYVIKNTIITEVLQELETVSKKLFMCFIDSKMMANVDKCHLLLSSAEDYTIEINGFTVKNSYCENLLGVHFDDQLKFDFHIEKLCKNANRKLHALARVTPHMDMSKR